MHREETEMVRDGLAAMIEEAEKGRLALNVRVCYAPPEVEDYQENLRKIGDAKERLIASGTYGAVYEITASQTSVGVAKKQRVDKGHGQYEEPIELVKKGAQYHCLMGQLQLGPKMSNCNVQFNSSNMPDLVTVAKGMMSTFSD
jgi:hypothetical protein